MTPGAAGRGSVGEDFLPFNRGRQPVRSSQAGRKPARISLVPTRHLIGGDTGRMQCFGLRVGGGGWSMDK